MRERPKNMPKKKSISDRGLRSNGTENRFKVSNQTKSQ